MYIHIYIYIYISMYICIMCVYYYSELYSLPNMITLLMICVTGGALRPLPRDEAPAETPAVVQYRGLCADFVLRGHCVARTLCGHRTMESRGCGA